MEVTYGFRKDFVFQDAVRFLKNKRPLPAEEYKRLAEAAKVKAFTVSGYTSAEVLQEFLNALEQAIEEGKTKEQFQKRMDSFLKDKGYEGLNPWKSDTIFRTNIQTAFQSGHYKSMTEPETLRMRPYWQYQTAGDGEVRETHAAMEGKVYRADDPIWDLWYPPNGFKCRCTVVSLTESQVERRGLRVEKKAPFDLDYETGEIKPVMPDKGFSSNPAKSTWKPDLSNISKPLREIFRERKAQKP